MFTSSTFNISAVAQDEADESEDELEDEVPWRSPSEKIAYVFFHFSFSSFSFKQRMKFMFLSGFCGFAV